MSGGGDGKGGTQSGIVAGGSSGSPSSSAVLRWLCGMIELLDAALSGAFVVPLPYACEESPRTGYASHVMGEMLDIRRRLDVRGLGEASTTTTPHLHRDKLLSKYA